MALPQFIFGIHDPEGAPIIQNAGKPGWVVATLVVTDGPPDFSALAAAGIGVIGRLNHGYNSDGTLPVSAQYDQFATQCASFVAMSRGCSIWIIGNETNSGWERPGNQNGQGGETITAAMLAQCFAKCRAKIKALAGHANDWIIPSAPAPWNADTGDWILYLRDMLNQAIALGQKPDAIALHTYTHGHNPALITSEQKQGDPRFQNYHSEFRTYRDYLAVVPASLKTVPVFITETQPVDPTWWQNTNNGWVRAAFKEIDDWNGVQANQPIQALCLFRWLTGDDRWSISNRNLVQDDFRAAMQNNYKTRWAPAQPPPPPPPPPPDPIAQAAQEAAIVHKPWMPINDQAALYKFAQKNGLGYPQTDEFKFLFQGAQYIAQVFNLGIVYVKDGDFANVMWVKKP